MWSAKKTRMFILYVLGTIVIISLITSTRRFVTPSIAGVILFAMGFFTAIQGIRMVSSKGWREELERRAKENSKSKKDIFFGIYGNKEVNVYEKDPEAYGSYLKVRGLIMVVVGVGLIVLAVVF